MFNTFRKHQRVLMVVITGIIIVAFAFLYDYANQSPLNADDVGKIYGRTLRKVDAERGVRYFRLAMGLGMMDMVQTLAGGARDEDAAVFQFIINLEVLHHEGRAMGIAPSNAQLLAAIKALPAFQTNGEYDPVKYQEFAQSRLGPLGFTERQIEEVAKDSLVLQRIREIITSQVAVGISEVDQALKMFQPVDLQVARFTLADAAKNVSVPEDEIIRYYGENKAGMLTNETRSVQFVKIDLPTATEGVKDKATLDALQKSADAIAAFADDAGKEGLEAAAKKAGYKLSVTPEFNQRGLVPNGVAGKQQDQNFENLAPAAFQLAAVGSVSDVIQSGNAFYVISLKNITPARALALEEVKARIQEKLKDDAARKAMEISARENIEKIRQLMKEGKSFAEAAKQAGIQVENIMSATPSPASDAVKVDTESQSFAASSLYLRDGDMSGLENAPWGGYVVCLVKRNPANSAFVTEQKPMIENFLQRKKEEILFAEWFRTAREAANFQTPRG